MTAVLAGENISLLKCLFFLNYNLKLNKKLTKTEYIYPWFHRQGLS